MGLMDIKKGLAIACMMVLCLGAMAQIGPAGNGGLLEVRTEVYKKLQENVQRYTLSQEEKASLADKLNIPLTIYLENNKRAQFQYLDEDNHPVYYTTHNVTAAITTGARALQPGGSLNLDLNGEGMVVGIYDQTRPRANHNEFDNRVTQVDGSTETISNHATHVTGTILARGNNANARGMANAATGWAFNWDADISKMMQNSYDPDLSPNGHLISNHSYGILVGWYRDSNGNWAWAGNESISQNEDYRFGFYTSKSRQIDELSFAKPYYTVVWAAGNDRSDVGDGSRDSDGPDDSIGPEGVAKNSLTIGAVNGITNYTGPGSVVMSTFSSWGPVDDGRIKPDLVGMGVNVFSTATVSDGAGDSYASLSGTSMAAPNITGSLLLLQELYRNRNAGRYMRSATLKALSIQTAKEAGMNTGPDYVYGWGLLDAEAAAELIINEDGSSSIIRELTLENNEVYELEFISNGIDPISATIAWTDPAGSPPAPSLNPTDLMLVNDLDMRIVDENGNTFFPWSLNPRQGSSAIAINTEDNFRDNVEKITINDPLPQRYVLRVSHKGNLRNNRQSFSLVVSAGVLDGQTNTLYWIGQDGNWNNPANWSQSNDGQSANQLPDEGTRVVIDRSAVDQNITLAQDTRIFSLNIFGDAQVALDLNDNDLIIESGFRASNNLTSIRNGKLLFNASNQNQNVLDFGQITFSNIQVGFDAGRWRVISIPQLQDLDIVDAEVEFDLEKLALRKMHIGEGSAVKGRLDEISFTEEVDVHETATLELSFKFRFTGQEGSFMDRAGLALSALINEGGKLTLQASGELDHLRLLSGETVFAQAASTVGELEMNQGVTLNLENGNRMVVRENIVHNESGGNLTRIVSAGQADFVHDLYKKYCFLNISVENVNLLGEAVINLGANAQVLNSSNWLNMDCENVLFANFNVRFTCVGALTEFVNTTEGNVSSYRWNFGSQGTSAEENPTFIFSNARTYTVSLEVRGPGGVMVYEQRVAITPNTLAMPNIVINGAQLTSQAPASSYQWYRNGEKIDGATSRSYQVEDGGSYQVTVIDDQCNRISNTVVVSSLENEPLLGRLGYAIGPNPVDRKITVNINNAYLGPVSYELYSSSGVLVGQFERVKDRQEVFHQLEINQAKGLYLLMIRSGREMLTYKLIKE